MTRSAPSRKRSTNPSSREKFEMLPYLAINWGMMVLRHAFDEDGVDKWLLGFCAAFAVSAPLLLAGQTPRSEWWVNHCDVLAPPVLALATVGILATLAPVFLARTIPHPVNRILVSVVITACGLWLASPLLVPCLAGPYVSPEVRTIIETQVTEALSASLLLQMRPELLLRVLMPVVVIAILALIAAVLTWDRLGKALRIALIQSFVVLLVGLAFTLVQVRAANLMTPAVPLLAGFLFHSFIGIPRDSPLRAPAALILLLSMPTVVETAGRAIAGPPTSPPSAADSSANSAGSVSFTYCRNQTALAEIASLPKSVVFSSLNLGPAIILYTEHAVTSAGYHRSAEAFRNGVAAFSSRRDLRNGLASSGADYLVVCAREAEERVISMLTDDEWPDWLIEVTGDRNQVRVFKVDKVALAKDHSGF